MTDVCCSMDLKPFPYAMETTARITSDIEGFDNGLLCGMTGKKIHEVELMSALIHRVAKQNETSHVLDLGSGQGYLSRALAYHHQLHVLAVDMSEVQTKGALRFDKQALKRRENIDKLPTLNHVTETVTFENMTGILDRWSDTPNTDWLICGLHACGDLSTFIMRLFATNSRITSLVNVGCCYHYLTEDSDNAGFPLSDTLKEMGCALGTTARVLACHSPWQWKHERKASIKSFEQHFYRALLQVKRFTRKLLYALP